MIIDQGKVMKKLKVIITGATGMVGECVLQECMANPLVEKILLINRRTSGYTNPKAEVYITYPFLNYILILLN